VLWWMRHPLWDEVERLALRLRIPKRQVLK